MDINGVLKYAEEEFGAEPEHLWAKFPSYCILRHSANRKWFALLADVPGAKLGLPEREMVDILNVKCDPLLIGSLLETKGFLPAYHMNKENWVTILLDGTVPDEEIIALLNASFNLTKPAIKKRKTD